MSMVKNAVREFKPDTEIMLEQFYENCSQLGISAKI